MAKTPNINEFRYKHGVLIRSAALSWKPGTWQLGQGATAAVAQGASNGFLAAPVFLTVTTPDGEVLVIQAVGKDAAKAHKLAAQITADARKRGD